MPDYPVFDVKKDKGMILLVPDMLPLHFGFIRDVLNHDGYHLELLAIDGAKAKEEGQRNVNNDACYPASTGGGTIRLGPKKRQV
jgi:predicted nucleotide-binding protein (sugar kinase/HSP70/actin superfamily)